jgi:hypothetical protein
MKRNLEEVFDKWEKSRGQTVIVSETSFVDFCGWVEHEGLGHYFGLRSNIGVRDDVERWFLRRFKSNPQ